MEFVKNNKGVIIFYLLIIVFTLIIVQSSNRSLNMENRYVYLCK